MDGYRVRLFNRAVAFCANDAGIFNKYIEVYGKRRSFTLPYLSYLLDSFNILIIVELLLVTSCVSTIIFILTKNEYVSLLSSAPVCFVFSLWKFDNTHLFLLLVAMFLQALIIVIIQHQNNKKLKSNKKEKVIENTDRL
jgi:hypothetical protein